MRNLLWLSCVTAGAIYTTTPPRAAKREAVEKAAESARDGAAEMIKSRLATQTTRPVFEQRRRLDDSPCRNDNAFCESWAETGECEAIIFAVCLAVGIVAALLSKRCFYPTKADGSEKPPRKIIIELPASPSSGQAAAPAEDDEEQPDVITN